VRATRKATATETTATKSAAAKATATKAAARKTTVRKAAAKKAADPQPATAATATGSPTTGAVTHVSAAGTKPDGPPDGTTDAQPASGHPSWPEPRPSAVHEILHHPHHALELLALATVRTLGPGARDWADRLRTRYPTAPPAGLARLATRRYTRLAGIGAALSVRTGLLAPVAELASITWAEAQLALRLAAAYGHDPTVRDRAVDLLVLARVHPDRSSAQAALAAAEQAVAGADGAGTTGAAAGWRLDRATLTGGAGWLLTRLLARRLPGLAILVSGLAGAATVERFAARATAYYRSPGGSQPVEPALRQQRVADEGNHVQQRVRDHQR